MLGGAPALIYDCPSDRRLYLALLMGAALQLLHLLLAVAAAFAAGGCCC